MKSLRSILLIATAGLALAAGLAFAQKMRFGLAVDAIATHLGLIRTLRGFTEHTIDQEPKWRQTGERLKTGYDPPWQSK